MNKVILALTLLALLPSLALAQGPNEGTQLSARTIPKPSVASKELQNALRQAPVQNQKSAKKAVPKTTQQWKTFIRKRDKKNLEKSRKLAKAYSVSVRPARIAGVNVFHVRPAKILPQHQTHLFVHLHEGAYVLNGGEAGTVEAILIASRLKIPVLSIDYRMPPKHPAPAAIEDVVAVWTHLKKSSPGTRLALGGSSTGAALAIASIHRFKILGLRLPKALYLGAPSIEIANLGDSRFLNSGLDRVLIDWEGVPQQALGLYASKYNNHQHPDVSPIYGNFSGFPPTYLISGTRDLLLSDTIRTHRKLRQAGVRADLHIYEGLSHTEYLELAYTPESLEHYSELSTFILSNLVR